MQELIHKISKPVQILSLGLFLLTFSLSFYPQEGDIVFAYNMNNLDRLAVVEQLVQRSDRTGSL